MVLSGSRKRRASASPEAHPTAESSSSAALSSQPKSRSKSKSKSRSSPLSSSAPGQSSSVSALSSDENAVNSRKRSRVDPTANSPESPSSSNEAPTSHSQLPVSSEELNTPSPLASSSSTTTNSSSSTSASKLGTPAQQDTLPPEKPRCTEAHHRYKLTAQHPTVSSNEIYVTRHSAFVALLRRARKLLDVSREAAVVLHAIGAAIPLAVALASRLQLDTNGGLELSPTTGSVVLADQLIPVDEDELPYLQKRTNSTIRIEITHRELPSTVEQPPRVSSSGTRLQGNLSRKFTKQDMKQRRRGRQTNR